MRKWIILGIGWVLILGGLVFFPWLAKRIQPKIIVKEVKVPVIQEKIVEKLVYKEGKEIVEKIVYKSTPLDVFEITNIGSQDNFDVVYRILIKYPIAADITAMPLTDGNCGFALGIKHKKEVKRQFIPSCVSADVFVR